MLAYVIIFKFILFKFNAFFCELSHALHCVCENHHDQAAIQ